MRKPTNAMVAGCSMIVLFAFVSLSFAQPPSCSYAALNSQCSRNKDNYDCNRAQSCCSGVVSYWSKKCKNGDVDPGTAATRVGRDCDTCLKYCVPISGEGVGSLTTPVAETVKWQ